MLDSSGWLLISRGLSQRLLKLLLTVSPFMIGSFALGLPFGIKGVALCGSFVLLAISPWILSYTFRGTNLNSATPRRRNRVSRTDIARHRWRCRTCLAMEQCAEHVSTAFGCCHEFCRKLFAFACDPRVRREVMSFSTLLNKSESASLPHSSALISSVSTGASTLYRKALAPSVKLNFTKRNRRNQTMRDDPVRKSKFEIYRKGPAMKPLVSILISAYNAEEWIGYTLQSAVAQTWPRKEIIVVDDGSTDGTVEIARRFASKGVTIFSTKNGGLSAGQNFAYRHSQGDYLQFLDADDLLAPDKIERQLAALTPSDSKRILLSSPWAPFYYRTRHARFVRQLTFGRTFLPWSGS